MDSPSRCPKCESSDIAGPLYDHVIDQLRYWCRQCGWKTLRAPADAGEERHG